MFKGIKLIVSEMDGVVTEHLAGIGEMNITMFKQFYMKDFEAINLIKKNYGFVFLSSDAAINMSLCKRKNLAFFHAERSKKKTFGHILNRYNVTPDNILYIGSSYSDVECMRMCSKSMCPEDAVSQVKNIADHVVPMYGGAGILCYIYDILMEDLIKRRREE